MVQAPGVRAPGRLDVGGGTVGDTPEFSSFGQPIESFMVMEGIGDERHPHPDPGWQLLRLQRDGRGKGPDHQQRAGCSVARAGADDAAQVGRQRVPRRRQLRVFEPAHRGQQRRRRAARAGHHGGQSAPEPHRPGAAISAAASSATSCGSTAAPGTGRRTSFSSACSSQTGRRETATRPKIITNQKISYQLRQSSKLVFWNTVGAEVSLRRHVDRDSRRGESAADRDPADSGIDVESRVAGSQGQLSGDVRPVRALDLDRRSERELRRDDGCGQGRGRAAGARNPDVQRREPRRRPTLTVRSDVAMAGWPERPSAAAGTTSGGTRRRRRSATTSPNLLAGNHEFKAGFEYTPTAFIQGNGDRGSGRAVPPDLHRRRDRPGRHADANRALQLPGHAAEQHGLHEPCTAATRGRLPAGSRSNWAAASSTIRRTSRSSAGRQARGRSPRPRARTRFRSRRSTSFAPRLYFSYDITGNGKTVLKGGWGRFYKQRFIEENQMTNPFTSVIDHLPVARPQRQPAVRSRRSERRPERAGLHQQQPAGQRREQSGREADGHRPVRADPRATAGDATSPCAHPGVYIRTFNEQRLLNILRPYEAYNIPISSPDPGNDGVVGNADDPGRTPDLLRLSRRRSAAGSSRSS